jgi:arginyl-tRNA synthetase
LKYDRIPYEKSIIITASEQNDYFKVMLKALEVLYPDLAKKTTHISHGMLRLPSGKMSSRTGKVITGESLLEDIRANVLEKMKEREMSLKEKNQIAEIVSVGALKFSVLKQVAGKDIIFDFDKSLSFEGDSGPYLQYSYVRAMSVGGKAVKSGITGDLSKMPAETFELEKILSRFSEVVERAGKDLAPHYIVTYLLDLASTFNTFYANNKIVDKDDMYSPYKVVLTKVFAQIMKNGLNLLGIKVPNKM